MQVQRLQPSPIALPLSPSKRLTLQQPEEDSRLETTSKKQLPALSISPNKAKQLSFDTTIQSTEEYINNRRGRVQLPSIT